MQLNFRKYGQGHPLFILHGVFGSSDNWQTVGKSFADHFTVYLIDQRNHGNSPHDDAMNYEVMSDDLAELMAQEELSSIYLLGHSMGGKTAMHFAARFSDKVDKLIVVDIAPKYYPPHHQDIFAGFHSVDLKGIETRKDAEKQMAEKIKIPAVRQFILKNLTRDGDNYTWKVNLKALEENIEKIGAGLPEEAKYEGKALFIGGSKSDYITEADHDLIKTHFPQAEIQMINGAGHWVHAEKPKELGKMVVSFLS